MLYLQYCGICSNRLSMPAKGAPNCVNGYCVSCYRHAYCARADVTADTVRQDWLCVQKAISMSWMISLFAENVQTRPMPPRAVLVVLQKIARFLLAPRMRIGGCAQDALARRQLFFSTGDVMIEVRELDQDSVRRSLRARVSNGMIILGSSSLKAALRTQTDIYAGARQTVAYPDALRAAMRVVP